MTINDPDTLKQFASGAFDGRFDRVVIGGGASFDVKSLAKQFSNKATFSSIKFTDVGANSIELDPRMRHAIVHYADHERFLKYLPTDYKSYTIFVSGDVVLKADDASVIRNWNTANHILIVLRQEQPSQEFINKFNLLKQKGELKNAHLLE